MAFNAAPGRYLTRMQFATGDALLRGIFGKPVIKMMHEAQLEWMTYEVDTTEPEMPTPMDYSVEGTTSRDYKGDKSELVKRTVPFAGRFRFTSKEGRYADVDFIKEIELIMADLRGRCAIPAKTGAYGQSFRYIVGDKSYPTVPRGLDFTVIGVTNIAPYASTQENPTWHQPFRKCWSGYVVARARALGYDAVFKYIGNGSIPYLHQGIRPDPNRKQSYERTIRYAVPTIQIGPFGSLKVTGKPRARHGKNRRRMG